MGVASSPRPEDARPQPPARATLVEAALVVGVAAVAVVIRLLDPLSSPVMATEDPYTHLVMTREHVARGYFDDSAHTGTVLYPPGMHALLAIFWSMSGLDLYQVMRLGAPLWGAVAAAGAFLVGRRFGGTPAGVVAGLLVAFIPEIVIRTNVFFPEALDLALGPFVLLALMEVAEGRRAWLAPAALVGLALTAAHPWGIVTFATPALLYAAAVPFLARRGEPGSRMDALVAGLVAAALAATAVRSRWRLGGSGFGNLLRSSESADLSSALAPFLSPLPWLGAAAAVGLVVVLARSGRGRAARVAASVTIALALAWLVPTLTRTPQILVDYPSQLGPLPIALALVAIVLIPFWPRNRLALMGAAIVTVTFPLTAIDFFESWYIPHRSVAYMAVGIAFLGASLAAPALAAAHRAWPTMRGRRTRRGMEATVAVVVALVLGAALTGAGAPPPEPWYRYYSDEQFEGVRFMEAVLEDDPNAVVLSGDWRPNKFLKALSPDMGRVWYAPEYYRSAAARAAWQELAEDEGVTMYVVVDDYLVQEFGPATWARSGAYEIAWECSCDGLTIYRWTG